MRYAWERGTDTRSAFPWIGLRGGDGGGTSDGVTEDWKASVDRQLGQLHGDVRALLYGLVAGFLFLIAAGWLAYDKLSDRVGKIEVQQQKTEDKIDIVSARLDGKLDLLIERTAPKDRRR